MSSPVGSLVTSLLRGMSQENEMATFIDNDQRRHILQNLFLGYYHDVHDKQVVFDTNRLWCSKLPLISTLFPRAKTIACVRHVPWIIDSIERLVRKNHLEPSKMFGFEAAGNVYNRFEVLGSNAGMVGFAYQSLREAFYSEESHNLMLLTYETLTNNPKLAMKELYNFIGEPMFEHDFDHVEFDAQDFDSRLGSPGLHRVHGPIRANKRNTILPPDLFGRMENDSFWIDPNANTHKVKIV